MSVALITVAVGADFQKFLPQWANAASQLETTPDEIIIVGDPLPEQIRDAIDMHLPRWIWMRGKGSWKRHPQILANEAIAFSRSEWICKIDADDLILPHALNPLENWEADVCMFGISVNGERNLIPQPLTARQLLASPHNPLFAGSPFRRAIWQQTPGFQDMIYDDWAFWRGCARDCATFLPSGTIDYLYRLHEDNSSMKADHQEESFRVFESEGT